MTELSNDDLQSVLELLEGGNADYVVLSDNARPLIDRALEAGVLERNRSGRMVQRPAQGPQFVGVAGINLPVIGALHETFDLTELGRAALKP